jgi:uncharacterized secreted protein with C-terminal beta-propeller domain
MRAWIAKQRNSVARRGLLRVESLEARQMLDAAAGDEPGLTFERFASGDELAQFLVSDALTRYDGLFGQPGGWWWRCGGGMLDIVCPLAAVDGGGNNHSETNTQVAGVDEADIIENDGDYLYLLSQTENEVVIIDAWPAGEMSVASRVAIDGYPFAEFLRGDQLAVLSHVYRPFDPIIAGGPAMPTIWPPHQFDPQTQVTLIDVSDRSAPRVTGETRFDGSFTDARAIGDLMYVVSQASFGLPAPNIICTPNEEEPPADDPAADLDGDGQADRMAAPFWWNPDETCVYETKEEYLARVTGHELELGLPHYTSTLGGELSPIGSGIGTSTGTTGGSTGSTSTGGVGETTGLLSEPTDIYKPRSVNDMNLVSITTFDLSGDRPGIVASTSVPSTYTTQIYASIDNLYLANPDWGMQWDGTVATSLMKFSLLPGGAVDLSAIGTVPGQILNQFSMDEYGGYFRIATTQGWGLQSQNSVYVLRPDLSIIGSLLGIGPGERIFSARFMGDKGFVVTFRQVDPLFALDLSDPAAPSVAGELHIPGFSNYLQSANDTYMIGIGRNADDTGRVQELQVSLFDVDPLEDPQLASRYAIDVGQWAWSEATTDHHAVGFYPGYDVLAIPVTNGGGWTVIDRDGDGTNEFYSYRPLTDLWVFKLYLDPLTDIAQRIELLDRVEHDGYIRRSVRIEDVLYAISDNAVTAHAILDPSQVLGRVHYGQEMVGLPIVDIALDDPVVALATTSPQLTPPVVIGATAASTSWPHEVVNHIEQSTGGASGDALVWTNLNQIKLTFSEDVAVGQQDLQVSGVAVSQYGINGFAYDADSRTAIWTLSTALPADRVSITLADSVTDRSGQRLDGNIDGTAGGAFKFTLSALPGDVNRDGTVDRSDLVDTLLKNFRGVGDVGFDLAADVDGDGAITIRDAIAVRDKAGTQLPAAAPSAVVAVAPRATASRAVRASRGVVPPRDTASRPTDRPALSAQPQRRLAARSVDAAVTASNDAPDAATGQHQDGGLRVRARRGATVERNTLD